MNISSDKYDVDAVRNRFEKLYERIPFSGCWIWNGALKNSFGHGAFKIADRKSKVMFSHRAAWELYVGEIPPNLKVLHRCDNPSCVNPHHLFLGSINDNVQDMIRKKRNAFGSKCKGSKLNENAVLQIKQQREKGSAQLSKIFSISRQSIADILYGRTWKHV